ncbi:MAG: FixH family protein [Candidatus Carbobacillus altaicus]|nr:FixH family protein [Candidatus Carbobacillus altaicus]
MHVRWLNVVVVVFVFAFILAGCGTKEAPPSSSPPDTSSKSSENIDPATLAVALKTDEPVYPTGEFKPYRVEIKDATGQPVDVDKVYYFMNMEGMHHPTEGTMRHIGPGSYELFLPLAMPGEWYAEITVEAGDKSHTFTGYHVQAEGKHYQQYMKGYNADELGEIPPDDIGGSDNTDHNGMNDEHSNTDDHADDEHSSMNDRSKDEYGSTEHDQKEPNHGDTGHGS